MLLNVINALTNDMQPTFLQGSVVLTQVPLVEEKKKQTQK